MNTYTEGFCTESTTIEKPWTEDTWTAEICTNKTRTGKSRIERAHKEDNTDQKMVIGESGTEKADTGGRLLSENVEAERAAIDIVAPNKSAAGDALTENSTIGPALVDNNKIIGASEGEHTNLRSVPVGDVTATDLAKGKRRSKKSHHKKSHRKKGHKRTGFRKLPPELRNQIYELVFSELEPEYLEKRGNTKPDRIDYKGRVTAF